MRVLTATQNTDDWYAARKGRITASNITKCLAGKNTKGRREYAMNIVLDLENVEDFRDDAPWFMEGRKYESYARGWYQWEHASVTEVGFVLHDEYNWLGASPDGLIGDDGNLEIKYRKNLTTFNDAIVKPIPRAYLYQMQLQMFVCDCQWTAYVNYWRNEALKKEQGHVQIVERDDALISELEDAAFAFWGGDVLDLWRERNGDKPIEFPWDEWCRKRNRPLEAKWPVEEVSNENW